MDTTYRPATEGEIEAAAMLLQARRAQLGARHIVGELWGERASEVGLLLVRCTSHYNDEYYKPDYMIVGLRGNQAPEANLRLWKLEDSEDDDLDDEDRAALARVVLLPDGRTHLGNGWSQDDADARRVVAALGEDWLGDERWLDGEGDPEQEIVVGLVGDVPVPTLYVAL